MDYNIINLQKSFHCNTVLSKFSQEWWPHPELSCSWHWSVKLTMSLPFSKQLALWWGFSHHSSHFTARMRVLLFLCVSIIYQARIASLSSQLAFVDFCCILWSIWTLQPTAWIFQGLLSRTVMEQGWWRRESDPQRLSCSSWDFTLSKNSNVIHSNMIIFLGGGKVSVSFKTEMVSPFTKHDSGKCKACAHQMRPSSQSRGETTDTIQTGTCLAKNLSMFFLNFRLACMGNKLQCHRTGSSVP